tara:strand:+ start:1442 stop:2503 length:1062 start_codon:yes stop_codon:yes gene_type:complete
MNRESLMSYTFTEEDLVVVLNFVRDYHLEPTKGSRGRTNQGKRGFGGELDEILPGKLIELACCKILQRYADNKELKPDFSIYPNHDTKVKNDPDITYVKDLEKNIERGPNTFIEIKRLESNSRWMGPRTAQLKENNSGYMIHASIEFDDGNNNKQQDIIASILSKLISTNRYNLDTFSSFENLIVKIEYIYSIEYLRLKGHFFPKGCIIPDTNDLFSSTSAFYNKNGKTRNGYEIKQEYDGDEISIKMKHENFEKEFTFADFIISGKFTIGLTKKKKEIIYAHTDVFIFSEVFGSFTIISGDTRKFYFKDLSGSPSGKNIDDYWFSRKRLDELIQNNELASIEDSITEIAKSI